MDRLDAAAIRLPGVQVRVVEHCDSTNSVLLKDAADQPTLLAAEVQTAGRGRRGRRWHSAPGSGITFSLARRIARPLREIAAVSLVAGVACVRALRELGVPQASLKWPNDLVIADAKLGGILVETRSRGGAPLAVVGVGINCREGQEIGKQLKRSVASLDQFIAPLPPRNRIIQKISKALMEALDAFEARGLDAVRREWEAMDAHAGRRLRVRLSDGRVVTGIAAGLAENGGLQLRTRAGIRAVSSGRVVSSRTA
jgi:BirA family biotin operon repressor/biotin-[acetyl-CoA-carboxylase] ligase